MGCSSQQRLVGQDWQQLTTEHFRIVTDAHPDQIKLLAQDLEKFRSVIVKLSHLKADEDDRLTIYAARDTKSYRALAGSKLAGTTAGLFIDSLYGHFAVVNLNGNAHLGGSTSSWGRRFLFHEYTHYLNARYSFSQLPYWYREGYAEMLSTMKFYENDTFTFGEMPRDRVLSLSRYRLPDLKKLLQATPEKSTPREDEMIYAAGWLLTHMLLGNIQYKDQHIAYLRAYNQGQDPIYAFENAFETSVDDFDQLYRAYRNGKLTWYKFPYNDGFELTEVAIHSIGKSEAIAEFSRILALSNTVSSESLEELLTLAESEQLETKPLHYSLAYKQLINEEANLANSIFSDFDENSAQNPWARFVFAEYLRWQVRQNPELRKGHLTRAYNIYKRLIEEEKNQIAAVWYGLGMSASQLMVSPEVYQRYFWKAYDTNPNNPRIALVYIQSLYDAEKWELFAHVAPRVLPLIADFEERQQLKRLIQQAELL